MAFAMLCVVPLSACHYGVSHNSYVNPSSVSFSGEHYSENEVIRIYAFNQQSGSLEQIGSAPVSGLMPGIGGYYEWRKTIDFTSLANKNCYFGAPGTCVPPAQDAQASIHFIDTDGPDSLRIFLPGFLACYQASVTENSEYSKRERDMQAFVDCAEFTRGDITIKIEDSSQLGS